MRGKTWNWSMALVVCGVILGSLTVHMGARAEPFDGALASGDPYAQVRLRWQEVLTGGGYDTSDPAARELVEQRDASAAYLWGRLRANAAADRVFPDLAMTQTTGAMTSTYSNLKTLAVALQTRGGRYYQNAALKSDLRAALERVWRLCYHQGTERFSIDCQSGINNWWDWEIGSPKLLNDIVVLLYDDLADTEIARYMEAVAYFMPDPCRYYYNTNISTGANRTGAAMVTAMHGVLTGDGVRIEAARQSLGDVFQYVTAGGKSRDGFYADGSFIQHDCIAYTGGYGLGLISDLSEMFCLFSGTAWAVDDPNSANVYAWMYQAFEPFVHSGMMLDAVAGRQIGRPYDKGYGAVALTKTAVLLSLSAPEDMAADLRSMAKTWALSETAARQSREWNQRPELFVWNILSDIKADPAVRLWETRTEYRQFAAMDRGLYRNPDYTFAVSMSSDRIAGYEELYGENPRGWHTGDGMTYLCNGDDTAYADAFWPTVDRYRLPGTTAAVNVQHADGENGGRTTAGWAGGVQLDHRAGLSCMRLSTPDGITASKAWFMLGREVVALGADIAAAGYQEAETIAENRKLSGSGEFQVDGSVRPADADWTEKDVHASWAHLAGAREKADIGYYFPGGAWVDIQRETRQGSWPNGRQEEAVYQSIRFAHGTGVRGARYAYVLLPGFSPEDTAAYARQPEITVLANTAAVQAVEKPGAGLTGIVFWKEEGGAAAGVSSDGQAAVIVEEDRDTLTIAVSDPTQKRTSVQIELDRPMESLASCGDGVQVLQLEPTVKLLVDVAAAQGASRAAVLCKPEGKIQPMVRLDRGMEVTASGGTCRLRELGSADLRIWAAGTEAAGQGMRAGGFDRVRITQRSMSWYKDHLLLWSRALAAGRICRIQLRFRVAPEDAAQSAETACGLRLRVPLDTGNGELELPVQTGADWQTARFVIDPAAKTLTGYLNGARYAQKLDALSTQDGELRLYLVTVPADAGRDQDGVLPLEQPVEWELDQVLADACDPSAGLEIKEVQANADGCRVRVQNDGVLPQDADCHLAVRGGNSGILYAYASAETGSLFPGQDIWIEGGLAVPDKTEEPLELFVCLWDHETLKPLASAVSETHFG